MGLHGHGMLAVSQGAGGEWAGKVGGATWLSVASGIGGLHGSMLGQDVTVSGYFRVAVVGGWGYMAGGGIMWMPWMLSVS